LIVCRCNDNTKPNSSFPAAFPLLRWPYLWAEAPQTGRLVGTFLGSLVVEKSQRHSMYQRQCTASRPPILQGNTSADARARAPGAECNYRQG
jgi:hypothetical protein